MPCEVGSKYGIALSEKVNLVASSTKSLSRKTLAGNVETRDSCKYICRSSHEHCSVCGDKGQGQDRTAPELSDLPSLEQSGTNGLAVANKPSCSLQKASVPLQLPSSSGTESLDGKFLVGV